MGSIALFTENDFEGGIPEKDRFKLGVIAPVVRSEVCWKGVMEWEKLRKLWK